MYQVTYINPLIQFGVAEYDALIEDDAAQLPSNRVHVKFPTESPTQEDFDVLRAQLIDNQNQLNYDKTQEVINYLREEVDKTTTLIINIFLTKNLSAMRAAFSTEDDLNTALAQYVGMITNAYLQTAQAVLDQFPNSQ